MAVGWSFVSTAVVSLVKDWSNCWLYKVINSSASSLSLPQIWKNCSWSHVGENLEKDSWVVIVVVVVVVGVVDGVFSC